MALYLDENGYTSDELDVCDNCQEVFPGAFEGLHGGKDNRGERVDYCRSCADQLGLVKCDDCRLVMAQERFDEHMKPHRMLDRFHGVRPIGY